MGHPPESSFPISYSVQTEGQLIIWGAMFPGVLCFSFSKKSSPRRHPLKTSRGDTL